MSRAEFSWLAFHTEECFSQTKPNAGSRSDTHGTRHRNQFSSSSCHAAGSMYDTRDRTGAASNRTKRAFGTASISSSLLPPPGSNSPCTTMNGPMCCACMVENTLVRSRSKVAATRWLQVAGVRTLADVPRMQNAVRITVRLWCVCGCVFHCMHISDFLYQSSFTTCEARGFELRLLLRSGAMCT